MLRRLYICTIAAAIGLVALLPPSVLSAEQVPEELRGVDVVEHLGEIVPTELEFTDHTGATVRLGDFLDGERPVILTLNYYGCPMLCGLQLNALTDTLRELDWTAGEKFRVVTISFAPDEETELAAAKRASHLESLGRGEVDWSFLTGSQASIDRITEMLGYEYEFIEETGEYAHPSVVMILSPNGTVSRYLYGLVYGPQNLRFSLLEASEGRIGSTVDRIILGCYMYDPLSGEYIQNAWAIMRLGGVLTVVLITLLLFLLWRTDLGSSPASRDVRPLQDEPR
jgi:protein SCO1/2